MKSRIISIALGGFAYWFLTCYISTVSYYNMSGFLTFFGSLFITICIIQAIAKFNNFYELSSKFKPAKHKLSHRISPYLFAPTWLFLYLTLSSEHEANIERALKDHGINCLAEIIDGKHTRIENIRRSTDKYELNIRFNDREGTVQNIVTSVSSDVYNSVIPEDKVNISYLPENVNILKLYVDTKHSPKEFRGFKDMF